MPGVALGLVTSMMRYLRLPGMGKEGMRRCRGGYILHEIGSAGLLALGI